MNLAFVEATGDHLCDVLTPTLVGRTLYLVGMGELGGGEGELGT